MTAPPSSASGNVERGQGPGRILTLVVAALVSAAVLSPDIGMPAGLPAIRLEQLLLSVLIPWIALEAFRNPAARTLTPVDVAFAALAGTITLSILVAPAVVTGVSRSPRDLFEVARVAEYWLLFRAGIAAAGGRATPTAALGFVAVVAAGEATFSIVQYLHPARFNYEITTIWTEQNNLLALERRGRVIGTIGNANYYGIFAGLTLLAGTGWLLSWPVTRRARALATTGIVASGLSVVLAQSRTVAGAVVVALAVLAAFVIADHRWHRKLSMLAAGGAIIVSVGAATVLMIALPPRFGGITERFNLAAILDDPAVTTRLSKWKSLWEQDADGADPHACASPGVEDLTAGPGHEATGTTGARQATPDAAARDARRKQDVSALYRTILDFRCQHNAWPAAEALEAALVPEFLPSLPADPATGDPYRAFFHAAGFAVAAQLEDASDPSGPFYAVGTIPNVLVNGSFEDGKSRPSSWSPIGPARVTPTTDRPLFGAHAAALELPLGTADGSIAGLRQVVPAAIYPDAPYVVAAWARGKATDRQDFQVHLVAITADGVQIEAFASRNFVLAGGQWQRLEVPFTTPGAPRIIELRLLFLAPYATSTVTVDLDGVTLTLGTFAPSFPLVRDVDPAAVNIADEPGFTDSPIIGVGPNKATATTFDNEYAVFLDRYGMVGTLAYVALWAATGWLAFRSARSGTGDVAALALAVLSSTVALAVFNVAAGSYYDFQLMGIFWPLAGLAAAAAATKAPTPGEHR